MRSAEFFGADKNKPSILAKKWGKYAQIYPKMRAVKSNPPPPRRENGTIGKPGKLGGGDLRQFSGADFEIFFIRTCCSQYVFYWKKIGGI